MAKNKVDITGVNTNNLKVLSQEEITDLFIKYQKNHDINAGKCEA